LKEDQLENPILVAQGGKTRPEFTKLFPRAKQERFGFKPSLLFVAKA